MPICHYLTVSSVTGDWLTSKEITFAEVGYTFSGLIHLKACV